MRLFDTLAVAASAASAMSLAACTKTDAPAISTIVDRDNATRKSYAQRSNLIAAPAFDPAQATRADLPAAAHYLDQVIPLMQSQLREIKSVGEPNASKDLYASMLDALAAVIHDEQAVRTAAHARDLHAFQAAYRADTVDATHLPGVAQQLGLTACLAG